MSFIMHVASITSHGNRCLFSWAVVYHTQRSENATTFFLLPKQMLKFADLLSFMIKIFSALNFRLVKGCDTRPHDINAELAFPKRSNANSTKFFPNSCSLLNKALHYFCIKPTD
jgi:hypothetical protein